MVDESTIEPCDLVGGCVGAVLVDNYPHVTPGRVRPFVWSYLLLRGAVRVCEVAGALAGHISEDSIRSSDAEETPLEATVNSVLGEMVGQGLLRLATGDSDLYVLDTSGTREAVSLVCQLNAQLPDHLLNDVAFQGARPAADAAPTPADAPVPERDAGGGVHGSWVVHRFRAVVRLRQLLGLAGP